MDDTSVTTEPTKIDVVAAPVVSVEEHINNSLGKVRVIFERASDRITALKKGEKVPATKLAEELSPEFGIAWAQLYPILKIMFDGYPGVKILKGAHGGIYKL